jgi:hypothetical protein
MQPLWLAIMTRVLKSRSEKLLSTKKSLAGSLSKALPPDSPGQSWRHFEIQWNRSKHWDRCIHKQCPFIHSYVGMHLVKWGFRRNTEERQPEVVFLGLDPDLLPLVLYRKNLKQSQTGSERMTSRQLIYFSILAINYFVPSTKQKETEASLNSSESLNKGNQLLTCRKVLCFRQGNKNNL